MQLHESMKRRMRIYTSHPSSWDDEDAGENHPENPLSTPGKRKRDNNEYEILQPSPKSARKQIFSKSKLATGSSVGEVGEPPPGLRAGEQLHAQVHDEELAEKPTVRDKISFFEGIKNQNPNTSSKNSLLLTGIAEGVHNKGTQNYTIFEQTHTIPKIATCDIEIRSREARAQQPEIQGLRHTVRGVEAALEESQGPTRECSDRGDLKPK